MKIKLNFIFLTPFKMALFSVLQIAEKLQVHQITVLKFIRKGVDRNGSRVFLRAVRFGRVYRVTGSDLDTFLKLISTQNEN